MGKMMRGHHGAFLRNPDVKVLALCDVESRRLAIEAEKTEQAYAEQIGQTTWSGVSTYNDFREVCAREDIDAVVVATPNHWHAIASIEAMKNGKDVYCEKPLARTIHEAKAIADTAERYGRVLQTGSQQRTERGFRRACEFVRNGRIGDVHTVHVNVGGPPVDCHLPPQPTPEGLDWDFWLGPAPWRPYHEDIAPPLEFGGWPNWRSYRDYAGGAMTDWGAHHFDIAQWGLGMDHTGPVEVIPPDGDQYQYLTYKYANGVVMHRGGADGRAGVEFRGTEGRVMVNRGYLDTDPPSLKDTVILPDEIHLIRSGGHHANWLDCIRTRRDPICSAQVGYRSATVCHIGNIAYQLQRPLKWDPDRVEFTNDAEANRLLSRPMRSPWTL
jgi:predicted dehydrogenase